jgi:NDP-sugar pyrophosphorylase family protein
MRGMILAAGLGTRFKPWTDLHPKALAIVNGKSLLQRNVEYMQKAGIFEVVVNVHHFAEQIVEAIEKKKGWGSKIFISDETDVVLETGGGLMKASHFLKDDTFVLMNVDILTTLDLSAMITAHRKLMPLATLATTNRKTSRYFVFDHLDNLCGW